MADPVHICNLALARIGEDGTVMSLVPPEGEQAKACATFYPMSLSALLASHDWRFATKRAVLAQVEDNTEEPADPLSLGWKYAYSLPKNCLRVIDIRSAEDPRHLYRVPSARYEIEAKGPYGRIYTDCRSPVCRYVDADPHPASYPALFVDALAWHLASALAGRVIKGKEGFQMAQYLSQQYQVALAKAVVEDAKEKEIPIRFIPEWIRVR